MILRFPNNAFETAELWGIVYCRFSSYFTFIAKEKLQLKLRLFIKKLSVVHMIKTSLKILDSTAKSSPREELFKILIDRNIS